MGNKLYRGLVKRIVTRADQTVDILISFDKSVYQNADMLKWQDEWIEVEPLFDEGMPNE